MKPGEINRYEFSTFQFFLTAHREGSRLRLVLSWPNTIRLEKNYNSGGVYPEEPGKDARTACITLYHGASHPSFAEFPRVN